MTKARFIYLLVIASLLTYYLAAVLRLHGSTGGFSEGGG